MYSEMIPISYLEQLQILSKSGRESIVYLSESGDQVYKIYKQSGFKKPTKEKIFNLYSRQKNILKTHLPNGLLFTYTPENGKEFIGIIIKNFKDYVSIDMLIGNEKIDMRSVFFNLISALEELTNNNVYPTDLNDKNILVNPNTLDIQILDLDGEHCLVSNKDEPDKLKNILKRLFYHVYSTILDNSEIDKAIRNHGYDVLSYYGYSNELIKMIKGEELLSYTKIANAVNELYPEIRKTL